MKRPGPLPAAPPRPERPRRADEARPEADEDARVDAPIRPLRRSGDDPPNPGEGPGDEDLRISGWRDVWKASRARRRALRAESRRFTARTRRRRWYWFGSLAAVVLLVAGTFGAAYSPLFAVRDVQVVGAERTDADEISSALDDQIGTPMPLVDHSAIRAALLEFPLIETYQVESRPPHELVVRIVERTPVGVTTSDAGYTVVDAAGVALATREEQPNGYPVIDVDGGTSSDAFQAVGQVLRSLPASLRERVSEATATTPEDVTLTFGASGARVVWGNAEQSARKALVLRTIMKKRPPAEVSEYDVSSPEAVVVR
ncbi:MAG: FtsQ-type POTRA domain-containing protein [Microbacterium sp.]